MGYFDRKGVRPELNRSEAGCMPEGSDQKICVVVAHAGDGVTEVDGCASSEAG